MESTETDLLPMLQEIFELEFCERRGALASELRKLKQATSAAAAQVIIQNLHREAHALKGAAGVVGMDTIRVLCEALERVFTETSPSRIRARAPFFDIVGETLKLLERIADAADRDSIAIGETIANLNGLTDVNIR